MSSRLEKLAMSAAQSPGKKVVVVEGMGDVTFLTLMLDKPPFRQANVFSRFTLLEVGGKDAVLKMLEMRPDFYAMVDRDAWTEKECAKKQKAYPNLFILPRFCIESFIICPEELEGIFSNFQEEGDSIRKDIPMAIRHGCLWRAAQPLYQQLMQAGFNRALLRYPPPNEKELDKLLRSWQTLLSPQAVQKACDQAFQDVQGHSQDELLREFVHGKIFWKNAVEPFVYPKFQGRSGEELKRAVFQRMSIPGDLEAFLKKVFQI